MSKKILKDHEITATKMGWCGLAGTVIDMELELYELKQFMRPKEIEKYEIVMSIYEKEKSYRIAEQCQGTDYAKYLSGDCNISN